MNDQLAVLAEISVGLTGFSAIIVAFRRGAAEGAWRPEDVLRFRVMLHAGLAAGLFAVLPAALQGLGVQVDALWPLLSAVLSSYLVMDLIWKGREMSTVPGGTLNPAVTAFVGVFNVGVAGVEAWNVVVTRAPGPYLFGVTWLSVYSGLTFYRLVMAPIPR